MYYLHEQPIPKETQQVFRRLCARTQDEQVAVEIILKEFFIETEEGWFHKRCDEDISKFTSKADTSRSNGKLGGRPKKTQQVILNNPGETQTKPSEKVTNNQEPLTNNQEPLKEEPQTDDCSLSSEPSFFDAFWSAYPKKVGKDAAKKAFKKIKKPSEVLSQILFALSWQTESEGWKAGYIPNPATYLNEGRWQDEEPPNKVSYHRRKDDVFGKNKKFNPMDYIYGGDGYGNEREQDSGNIIDIGGGVAENI
jgi:uncharacterized protein YdaU (DUF1376 family)